MLTGQRPISMLIASRAQDQVTIDRCPMCEKLLPLDAMIAVAGGSEIREIMLCADCGARARRLLARISEITGS
jgi:hypothetical protein